MTPPSAATSRPTRSGWVGGSNPYGYAGANPVGAFDPDGKIAWWVIPLGFALWELGNQAYDLWLANCDPFDPANFRWGNVGLAFGSGMIGGGIGGGAVRFALRGASNRIKGKIGEKIAQIAIRARGGRPLGPIGSRARSAGSFPELGPLVGRARRARPDIVYKTLTGKIRVLEAKYGTSQLTGAQRALEGQLGDIFSEFRVTEKQLSGVAAAVGATAGGFGDEIRN